MKLTKNTKQVGLGKVYKVGRTRKGLQFAGADAGFQKSQSKFLNKFPAQPYLGYFRYQLTKYQFFEIYIIITIVIIIVILLLLLLLLLSSSSSLLLLFLLKFWSVVGLWGFRFHQLVFKHSQKEVLILTCGRVLLTHFCLQPFFPQRFSFFTAWLVLSLYLDFQLADKCISDTISNCRSIACKSFACSNSNLSCK